MQCSFSSVWCAWHDLCLCRPEFLLMNPVHYLRSHSLPRQPLSLQPGEEGYTSVKWQPLWEMGVWYTWLSSHTDSSSTPQTTSCFLARQTAVRKLSKHLINCLAHQFNKSSQTILGLVINRQARFGEFFVLFCLAFAKLGRTGRSIT